MFETVGLVARILTASRSADKALKASTSMALLPAISDARAQLSGLVYPGFVSATGLTQLRHLPRYLGGINARLTKLVENPSRDRVWMNEVQAAQTKFTDAGGTIPLNRVAELIDAGTLKTTVGEHFGVINAANLRRAHALLESGKAKGKIVLEGF